MEWSTVSRGGFNYEDMLREIRSFIHQDENYKYELWVGTDSHKNSTRTGLKTRMVNTLMIRRVGKGGQYYFKKTDERYIPSLKQQIDTEAGQVLMYTCMLHEEFQDLIDEGILEIIPDVDVGKIGKTKEYVNDVVGMFTNAGYSNVKIKPYSACSSGIADKHTR